MGEQLQEEELRQEEGQLWQEGQLSQEGVTGRALGSGVAASKFCCSRFDVSVCVQLSPGAFLLVSRKSSENRNSLSLHVRVVLDFWGWSNRCLKMSSCLW